MSRLRKDKDVEAALRAANSVLERNRRPSAAEEARGAIYIAAALVMSFALYALR